MLVLTEVLGIGVVFLLMVKGQKQMLELVKGKKRTIGLGKKAI